MLAAETREPYRQRIVAQVGPTADDHTGRLTSGVRVDDFYASCIGKHGYRGLYIVLPQHENTDITGVLCDL
jgi:hypothetical protein